MSFDDIFGKNEKDVLTTIENATLADNFIFYRVMHDHPDECKKLLEILLNVKINKIEMINEKNVDSLYESKGIRLDVFVKDDLGRTFDVEMQTVNSKNLPKRARYYQSVMDVDSLKTGQDYDKLSDTFVIFLCMKDFFKQGLPIYTFQNICMQDNNLKLNDRTFKLFFNAENCDKMTDERQKAFFNLLKNKDYKSPFTETLSKYVMEAKMNIQDHWTRISIGAQQAELREKAIEEGMQEGIREGIREGIKEGLKEGIKEGVKEGTSKAKTQITENLIRQNKLTFEQISEAAGLSLEAVKEIASKINITV